MKTRKLAAALAALMMLSCAGCSSADSSSSGAAESSKTEAPAADSSAESKDTADARDAELERLSAEVKQLSEKVKELEKVTRDFTAGSVHEIYDDTAVIEAYKNQDSSKLTDDKDKFVYDNLVTAMKEIITDGMDEFEKEKAVYDYIFKNTHFNYNNLNPLVEDDEDWSHTPYGFFRDHSTICVGYATTFKLFMDALGIDCEIIHSTAEGEHAWDTVKIGGDWYHVDIFYDGGETQPLYQNFNVTDEIKKQGSYKWDIADFHECTSLKYNYVCMNAVECKDIYAVPAALKKAIPHGNGCFCGVLPVPEGVDGVVFASQLDDIFRGMYWPGKVISGAAFADSGSDKVYITVGISDEPDYNYEEPYDDSRYADIDYNRFSDLLSEEYHGVLSFTYYDENYCDDSDVYRGEVK